MSDFWNFKTPCKRRNKQKSKEYHQKHKEKLLHRRWVNMIKQKYNLTEKQYNDMWDSQGHKCKICPKTDFGSKRPVVDHDHKTGEVRGLLCSKCNSLLGFANDNLAILEAAKQYLLESRKKQLKLKKRFDI
jgi:hypothetical protein